MEGHYQSEHKKSLGIDRSTGHNWKVPPASLFLESLPRMWNKPANMMDCSQHDMVIKDPTSLQDQDSMRTVETVESESFQNSDSNSISLDRDHHRTNHDSNNQRNHDHIEYGAFVESFAMGESFALGESFSGLESVSSSAADDAIERQCISLQRWGRPVRPDLATVIDIEGDDDDEEVKEIYMEAELENQARNLTLVSGESSQ
jgi:hypothetical protein